MIHVDCRKCKNLNKDKSDCIFGSDSDAAIKKCADVVIAFLISIIISFVAYFVWVNNSERHQEFKSYKISEIESGIYVKYSQVVSNIPANNYEIAIYQVGNEILTTKGNVEIHFTNEEPYVKIKKSIYVNNETAIFYVKENTVEYPGVSTISSGRR